MNQKDGSKKIRGKLSFLGLTPRVAIKYTKKKGNNGGTK